jgi:TPR repeat protein
MRRGDGARTPAAAYSLGERYRTGEGMPQDHRKAARLFRLAADQGHAQAQLMLGVCYARGEGVPQSHSEAARYFGLAADQGIASAQYNYAVCNATGDGVPQDHSVAARYYRLAADQGHALAQFSIARCYTKGEGVLQDYSEAARYNRLAADQGLPPAQMALGGMLIRDVPVDERVPTDPRAGAKLLARVVQCEGAKYEDLRLQALELLRKYADKREVVAACCIGCGASRGLKTCDRCHVARFCGRECIRQMWPTHKRCCQRWANTS